MLQEIIDLQEKIDLEESSEELLVARLLSALRDLEGHRVCLMVSTADGYLQLLHGGGFQPVDGGQEFVLGHVVDKGIEPVSDGAVESYLIVNIDGQPLSKVFVNGIRAGFVLSDDTLLKILREALMGDDNDRLRDVLEEVGVRRL